MLTFLQIKWKIDVEKLAKLLHNIAAMTSISCAQVA